jgi:hypothetical protein
MRFLNWNHKKVQNLTPWEIWMFIAGRVFMSFGIGVLAMRFYPQSVSWSGFSTFILGIVLLGMATKGLLRKSPPSD